jgi:hypothetical protein
MQFTPARRQLFLEAASAERGNSENSAKDYDEHRSGANRMTWHPVATGPTACSQRRCEQADVRGRDAETHRPGDVW